LVRKLLNVSSRRTLKFAKISALVPSSTDMPHFVT
jgi:hypothetical protein